MLKEHDEDYTANEKQLSETTAANERVSTTLLLSHRQNIVLIYLAE